MALKYKYTFKQIPSNATPEEFEDFLNTQGVNGWQVIQIVIIGTNRFVLASKQLSL